MKYSILHISDIHKKKGITYESLLQSLERDMQSIEEEGIIRPSLIVVSGDLVQGAADIETIRNQYREVETFLERLCEVYLSKERKRMIIVPGNHDVDWSTTKASMALSSSKKDEDCKKFFELDDKVRWSWKEYSFYHINNVDEYDNRFHLFVEFYNRFFNGIRKYPQNPEKEAYVETFWDYRVSFVGFNSCNRADHLRDVGCIAPESLVDVGNDLLESYNRGFLNIGVWHHNYYGSPMATNYMDRRILDDMIQYNIHVGLFGHQHYAQVATEYVDLLSVDADQTKRLLLISSGTLFGGKNELAPGHRRQYNVIEVDTSNGQSEIAINVREDANNMAGSIIPYWRKKNLSNSDNKIHFVVNTRFMDKDSILRMADRLIREEHKYIYACDMLSQWNLDDVHVRSLYFDGLKEIKDYEYVYHHIPQVKTVEEAFLLITAVDQLRNPAYITSVLNNEDLRNLHDVIIDKELNRLSKYINNGRL